MVDAAAAPALDAAAPDAAPDAAPVTGFDYDRCPASYRADVLPGPSRYRLIIDGHRAWEQSDACNLDLPGATHLVILESAAELAAVAQFLDDTDGIAHNALWIGGVQRRTATSPGELWIGFDGAPLIDQWNSGEPDDDKLGEADHKEQFAMVEHDRSALADEAGSTSSGALCECDGKPLGVDVIPTIESNRLKD